jgi:hypothetical protein
MRHETRLLLVDIDIGCMENILSQTSHLNKVAMIVFSNVYFWHGYVVFMVLPPSQFTGLTRVPRS